MRCTDLTKFIPASAHVAFQYAFPRRSVGTQNFSSCRFQFFSTLDFLSLAICFSTARVVTPSLSVNSGVVVAGNSRNKEIMTSSVFPELFPDGFTAVWLTVAVNRHPTRSSVKSISGHASNARLMPEPSPLQGMIYHTLKKAVVKLLSGLQKNQQRVAISCGP